MWGKRPTTPLNSQGPKWEQQVSLVRRVVIEIQQGPSLKLLIKAKSLQCLACSFHTPP